MTSWRPFLFWRLTNFHRMADGLTVTHTQHSLTHTHARDPREKVENGHSCALWTRHSATGLLRWAAGRRLNTRQWPTSRLLYPRSTLSFARRPAGAARLQRTRKCGTFRQNKSLGHVKQLVKFRLLQLSIQAPYLTLSKPWCVLLWKRLLLFRVAVIRLSRTTADDAQSYRSIAHASCILSFFFFVRLWLWHQQQLSPFLFFHRRANHISLFGPQMVAIDLFIIAIFGYFPFVCCTHRISGRRPQLPFISPVSRPRDWQVFPLWSRFPAEFFIGLSWTQKKFCRGFQGLSKNMSIRRLRLKLTKLLPVYWARLRYSFTSRPICGQTLRLINLHSKDFWQGSSRAIERSAWWLNSFKIEPIIKSFVFIIYSQICKFGSCI